MWKSLKVGAALSGVLLLGLAACNQSPPASVAPKGPSLASQEWNKLTASFIQSYLDARPSFAAQSGRHEYDGQLPDLSNHGIRREIARLHDQRDQVAAVDPKTLEPRERFDREYLLAVVDRDLFWMEKAKFPFSNPSWYIDRIDPDMYLNRNYAPLDVRMKAYIKYARAIPKMVNDIKANLQSPMPKTFVELGIAQFGGLADFYSKKVTAIFASVSDPELQKQLADADTAAAQAMDALKQTLEEYRKKANDKFRVGSGFIRADDRADRERESAGRSDRGRGARRPRAQYGGAQDRVRRLCTEGSIGAMHCEDVRSQAEGRSSGGCARPVGDAQGLHRQEQRGLDTERR